MAPGSVTRCCRARAALGRNAQERPVTQAARPQTRPAAAQTVAVAAGLGADRGKRQKAGAAASYAA